MCKKQQLLRKSTALTFRVRNVHRLYLPHRGTGRRPNDMDVEGPID